MDQVGMLCHEKWNGFFLPSRMIFKCISFYDARKKKSGFFFNEIYGNASSNWYAPRTIPVVHTFGHIVDQLSDGCKFLFQCNEML